MLGTSNQDQKELETRSLEGWGGKEVQRWHLS